MRTLAIIGAAVLALLLAGPAGAQDETIDDLRVGDHLRLETLSNNLRPPCFDTTDPAYGFDDGSLKMGMFCFPSGSLQLQSRVNGTAGRSYFTLGLDFAEFVGTRAEALGEFGVVQIWDRGEAGSIVSLLIRDSGAVFRPYRFRGTEATWNQPLRINITGGLAKPTCAVGTSGTQWPTTAGAGVAETYEICNKDAADVYAWRSIVDTDTGGQTDTVVGSQSVTNTGDNVDADLRLVGDVASPGNSRFYGTNGSGTRGWYEQVPAQSLVALWAEENAALGVAAYEWAFGNGASTPNDGGVTYYCPTGWTCEVVALSLRLGSGTATVELVLNGTLQGASANVVVSSGQGATNELGTPVAVASGDYLNFRTTTSSGTSAPNVVTAWIRHTAP